MAALSDAALNELIGNGNVVLFSSHNHDWAAEFMNRSRNAIRSHFSAQVHGDDIKYDHTKKPGGAPSLGIEVARAYGMPKQVIEKALAAPDVRFV